MDNNNKKFETTLPEDMVLAKIDELFKDRNSSNFLEKIHSLEPLFAKRKLLNTIKLLNKIHLPSVVEECCKKPLFTHLQIEHEQTVLDLLFEKNYENYILAVLKKTNQEDQSIFWSGAVKNGSTEIIKWLIENDPTHLNTPDQNGFTPGALAVLYGQKDIALILKKADAHFGYITNEEGHTIWHIAALKKDAKLLENCIEFGIPINVADKNGYTAAYYMLQDNFQIYDKVKPELLDLNQALNGDIFNTIRKNDVLALNKLLDLGVSASSKNALGYTLLDVALVKNNAEIIQVLKSYNAKIGLYENEQAKTTPLYEGILENPHENYNIQINKHGETPYVSLSQTDSSGRILSKLDIAPWKNNEANKLKGDWKVVVKGSTCYIFMSKNDTLMQPDLLCELTTEGNLRLQYVNLPACSLQLTTYNEVIFDSIAAVKNLKINSENIYFSQNSKFFSGHTLDIEANTVCLEGNHKFKNSVIKAHSSFKHKGDFVSELLNVKAENASIFGQLMITNKMEVELAHQFNCYGSIVVGRSGKIKANNVHISKSGNILVQQGELSLYGAARVENSGSVIGDRLLLSSGMVITNNHGALIKGLSCILTAPQINQGGVLLAGKKTTLSYVDWGFNVVQASLKLAEVGAYVSPPTAIALRGYLLAAKTMYHAGNIAYKVMNSQEIHSSELVALILDNLIPAFSLITCQEEQAKILVNILYHCYGHYQSEEEFIQKSLQAIEVISRAIKLSSVGMLSEEHLIFLEKSADYIRYSRLGFKVAKLTADTILDFSNNDVSALEKAKINFGTMLEGAVREYIYTLEPLELFDAKIQLPARDLVLYILNKNYNAETFLQSLVYGALHVAKQQGLISTVTNAQIDIALQALMKSKHWAGMYQNYQKGQLSLEAIASEAIDGLLVILRNPSIAELIQKTVEEPRLTLEEKTLPVAAPIEESESELLTLLKKQQEELIAFDERSKLAQTEEEIEALRKAKDELCEKYREQARQLIPEREIQNINIDTLAVVESALTKKALPNPQDATVDKKIYHALLEVQKAFFGEYASEGYLAAFADAFHNEGSIKVQGDSGFYTGKKGTNSGQMHASGSLGLFGQEVYNRESNGKIVSEALARLSTTQFTNFDTGMITAEEAINAYCVGVIDNFGVLDSHEEIKLLANRVVKNHKEGKIIAKNEVSLLCDLLADNNGIISGAQVIVEGIEEGAKNSGKIIGLEKIRLISEKLAINQSEGELIAPKVDYEASTIVKDGSTQAVLVQTLGYSQAEADNVTWKKNEGDAITALTLKPKATDHFDADAFTNVTLLDVTLSAPFENEFAFQVSSDFSHTLQFHLPESDKVIPIYSLPTLSSEATFILDAPGHTLSMANLTSEYGSNLRFTGQAIDYSYGKTTFNQSVAFDTKQITGLGGSAEFYLKKGGFIQAEKLLNRGYFHSDGIINWNLAGLTNDAELETYNQYFYENKAEKDKGIKREYCATRLLENSGTIYALGHQGHLGVFNQHGGVFRSGDEGHYVYHTGGTQRAILTHEGRQTAEVIEDGGQNWHVMPIWKNAEIKSTGHNIVIGSEKIKAEGINFYGDKEAFLYAAKGVEIGVQETAYHIPATESRTKSGKLKKYIHVDEKGFVITRNNISSSEGELSILAPDGDVSIINTIIASEKNVEIIAKDKVTIDGVEHRVESNSKARKRHGLLNHKKTDSNTIENRVDCSYIITNGTLTICCNDLELDAVKGSIAGDFNLLAKTANMKGKKQTYKNTTKTTEIRLSMPALDNLNSIVNGENAKVIFGNLIRTFGWNAQELDNILHAKSVAELPKSAVIFARDTYNLTAFVAHACNELGESPSAFAGAVTDRMGLTTQIDNKRVVNPHFNLKLTKTTERTEVSQTITTDFKVGGTFRMIGDTLYLLDGASVDAEHLRIFLVEGIKATSGVDKVTYARDSKSIGLGVNALNPQEVDISFSLSKAYQSNTSACQPKCKRFSSNSSWK